MLVCLVHIVELDTDWTSTLRDTSAICKPGQIVALLPRHGLSAVAQHPEALL